MKGTKCIGFDLGSSSVKVAIIDTKTGALLASCQYPEVEMAIQSPRHGFAEQNPQEWWSHCQEACRRLMTSAGVEPEEIGAIGLAYQMHGLVCLDEAGAVLRPAIIWCDSRAVAQGEEVFRALGSDYCLGHLLNSPGNFTASKLRWVQENEPEIFQRIHTVFLPGDYLAWCMTGIRTTTVTGLSEGVFWDFRQAGIAKELLDHWGITAGLLPPLTEVFGTQGVLTREAAQLLGLREGIPVCYRAGDQPNNALSLGVLEPGEIAATGGTSGVVYAVADTVYPDMESRVNAFAHVNHQPGIPRIGVLLCINGTGILYSWLKNRWGRGTLTYTAMEAAAASVVEGSDGLTVIPFGNGSERMLGNRHPGASISGIDFNRHSADHIIRASLEGIAFSFRYGMNLLTGMGIRPARIRAGNDNLFQSALFSQTLANLSGCVIEVLRTNGAAGAARAAAFGFGAYPTLTAALGQTEVVKTYQPAPVTSALEAAAQRWQKTLEIHLS